MSGVYAGGRGAGSAEVVGRKSRLVVDKRRPHGEVLRGRAQPDEQAILLDFRVMDDPVVYVDVDGRNRAVEGRDDLRQGEESKQSMQCHGYVKSIKT
jgi:hypothetical protein